jgi:phosphoglycerol transferase
MRAQNVFNSGRAAPVISLLALWLACAVCMAWTFWPLSDWIRVPLVYEGDGLWNLFVIKTVLETGWYGSNVHLGAPFTATFLDFAKPESLYLLMFHLAGWVTSNVMLIHNLFYFAGFFMVAGSALLVLRRGMRLQWALAVLGALLYAFLPFHWMRQGHLFLSNYFVVPIAVWMALTVTHDQPPFFTKGRWGVAGWPLWLAAAVVASTSIYYTFFALVLIASAGCLESIRTMRWRSCISAVLVSALVALFLVANLFPSILYRAENGANSKVATRPIGEIDRYALQPVQLLLPTTAHRLPAPSELTRKYEAGAPFVNENRASYLGLLGAMGFLFLLVALVAGHRVVRQNQPLGVIARLNVIALSLSIAGGGAMILGLVLSPQFRALNRMSVVIAFVSIAGLMLVLDSLARRIPAQSRVRWSLVASVLLAALGVWDQVPLNARPDTVKLAAEFDSDRAFVRNIEARLPDQALVLQWPYTPFPETAPRFKETAYSHLRGYLHGAKLRWSYGGMKGRMSDSWHASLAQLPLPEQIRVAKISGFRGIWLDRRAISDGAMALEAELRALGIVEALESSDKNLVFYSLPVAGNAPSDLLPPPMLGTGFYPWEGPDDSRWAWSNGASSLVLLNPGVKTRRTRLSFTLNSLIDRSVEFTLDKKAFKAFVLPQNKLERFEFELDLPPGGAEIVLTSAQAPVRPNSADSRLLSMAISNLQLIALE